jgi:tRNA A64-2'-O-ribosylphosphate transferase
MMPDSSFPATLADLNLNDKQHIPSLYASIRLIKKSTLSIHNRLNSILADSDFAKQVSNRYELPLVANERCGSWYIDPRNKVGSAYFKSTDGHHGQWAFSSRRLNLQLVQLLAEYGGAVIVDSTRRGKNLPDAFSKTIPIWVAVLNRVLFPEVQCWHGLQTAPEPDRLGASEIAQIEARLEGFADAFSNLGLDLEALRSQLKYPMRIIWATNGQWGPDDSHDEPLKSSFHRLVLCSASRRVRGAEISEQGYIQGAGDDSEAWSYGLTAPVFWRHKELLLQTVEDDQREIITSLLEQDRQNVQLAVATRIHPTANLFISAGKLGDVTNYDLFIDCHGSDVDRTLRHLPLCCRDGKLGSRDLREKLAGALEAMRSQLSKNTDSRVLVSCKSGKDLSIGVAVAILCVLYDSEGTSCFTFESQIKLIISGRVLLGGSSKIMDKQLVKKRLAWISNSKADASPSRATLQAVNSYLMPAPT